jgi:VWFA-related protein
VFECVTLRHPMIQRRLPGVIFRTEMTADRPSVAWFDPSGDLRFEWPIVPDTINFGVMLDSALYGVTTSLPAPPADTAPLRILPLGHQVVTGRHMVTTRVASASIARVEFSLDGGRTSVSKRPPFWVTLDFGAVPERHVIRAVAFDRKGKRIAHDERIVNEGGETFWLRLLEPREGYAEGKTRVSMDVRVPVARRVQRVVISWNDAERAVLTSAPWERAITIPKDELGILRAVAELDDGTTSEDAVLLNAGYSDQSNVQLVQLPITIFGTYSNISVREGTKKRRVESIATAAETPLTVGLLLDTSDSMEETLPDLQEAAIRFLDTILGPRDRAFIISFDTRARLLQPPTHDVARISHTIMLLRPDGLTSIYDAMALGLLQFEGVKGRRAMILFTDGRDVTSEYSASDVGELARRVSVPIHVIGTSQEELTQIARATGGTSQTLDRLEQLPGIFSRIEAALRAQVLAFVRTDPAKKANEWRPVQVDVTGPNPEVHAPSGYYATW